jgi:hypothetical protein
MEIHPWLLEICVVSLSEYREAIMARKLLKFL